MAVAERAADAGIRERWHQLYTDYYKVALGVARQGVQSQADAEDAAQVTFLNVYEILASGKPVENWEAMIATIAKRQAGKERASGERTATLEPEVAVDQVAERDAAERREAFEATFGTLSEAEQQALYFTLVEGLSATEVGERLGTSAESARHLLSRGRARAVLDMVTRNVADDASADDRPLSDICRYLANRMSVEERRAFASHLKTCARCRLTVERVREFRGFVLLLLPAGLIGMYGDRLYAQIQTQQAAAKGPRRNLDMRLVAAGLLLALIIGTVVIVTHRRSPTAPKTPAAVPAAAVSGCPTGKVGGFTYIDSGNVIYRSSPTAPPQQVSSSGLADSLLWTPDGTTLIYKDARTRGPVAGTLYAVHPGSAPFWSFGTAIDSFAISPDGKEFAALIEHDDANRNWVGWTLHIGAIGTNTGIERYVATPVPDQWQEPVGTDPFAEANYGRGSILYAGVFWFGQTIYIGDAALVATFDESANRVSTGWGTAPSPLVSALAAVSEAPGSALHYLSFNGPVSATCGSSTKSVVAPPAFMNDSSSTLTLSDDPHNPHAALAVEMLAAPSSGDIFLLTADGTVSQLTTDHAAYLPAWQP